MIKFEIDGKKVNSDQITDVEESMSDKEVRLIEWDDFEEMLDFARVYLGDMGEWDFPNVTVKDEEKLREFQCKCINEGRFDDGDYL